MTSWLIFLLVIAFCLSMVIAMLKDCDEALREADLSLRLDAMWDDIEAHLGAESTLRDDETLVLTSPVRPDCCVCDDLGCEFCPRVDV